MTEANPLLHQKNVQMLMATLEELRTNSETANDVRTFGELESKCLRKHFISVGIKLIFIFKQKIV